MRKLHWNPFKIEGDATFVKVMKTDEDFPLSVPAVVLYHVGQLNDVLPLLVLLTQLKGLLLQRDGALALLKQ